LLEFVVVGFVVLPLPLLLLWFRLCLLSTEEEEEEEEEVGRNGDKAEILSVEGRGPTWEDGRRTRGEADNAESEDSGLEDDEAEADESWRRTSTSLVLSLSF
jgi:hypothetical protein